MIQTLLRIAGYLSACLLAASLAGLSALHWIVTLEGQAHEAAITLAVVASVCVSLLGFTLAYMSRSYGMLLLIPAAIFAVCDVYQNSMGFQTMKALTVSSEMQDAETRLDEARSALAELPLPSVSGPIRRKDTWEAVNKQLSERVTAAKADVDAFTQPETQTAHVAAALALLQFALCLAFACLGKRPEPAAPKPMKVRPPVKVETSEKVVKLEPREQSSKDLRALKHIAEAIGA